MEMVRAAYAKANIPVSSLSLRVYEIRVWASSLAVMHSWQLQDRCSILVIQR